MPSLRFVVLCIASFLGPLGAVNTIRSQEPPPAENERPQPTQQPTEGEVESASIGSDQSVDVDTQEPLPEEQSEEQNTQSDIARSPSELHSAVDQPVTSAETTHHSQANRIPSEPQDGSESDTSWPQMKIRARVMTGWEYRSERPAEAQGRESDSEQQFFLQQARLGLKANLVKRVIANISADLSDGLRPVVSSVDYEEVPYLRNAYINVRVKKAFQIRAGRFKRPFSRLENTSSGSLPFRGRGLSNGLIIEDTQWGDRAIGLMFWGRIRSLGLTWKASMSNPDWGVDNDMEIVGIDSIGQIIYKPIKWMSVGVNYGHKLTKPRGIQSVNTDAFGGDFRLDFEGFRFSAEALTAQLSQEENEPFAFGVIGYTSYDFELSQEFVLQPTVFGEYADANSDYTQTEAIRVVIGINLLCYQDLRVLPQVEIIRPIGKVSSYNPWISGENVYILFSLQL